MHPILLVIVSQNMEEVFKCGACGKVHKATITTKYRSFGTFREPDGEMISYPLSFDCPVNGKEQTLNIQVKTSKQKEFLNATMSVKLWEK
jgi:transcription elongation factor Elf1